jgi:hypothetical protein
MNKTPNLCDLAHEVDGRRWRDMAWRMIVEANRQNYRLQSRIWRLAAQLRRLQASQPRAAA